MTDSSPPLLGRPVAPPTAVAPPAPPIAAHPFGFSGSAGEYFRIWIVNVALTVVTLGIYGAWAKVRTRRYFYGHTSLGGHAFEYTANPVAILVGHVIVAVLFGGYVIASNFGADETLGVSIVGLALLGVLFVATPYLVWSSLRFMARNTVYRGLRFGFHGGLGEAYQKYLLWPLLTPPTLGLIFPYVSYLQRGYMAGHAGYGTARTEFRGTVGPVYIVYLIGFALGACVYTVGIVMLFVAIAALAAGGLARTRDDDFLENIGAMIGLFSGAALAYAVILLGLAAIAQFLRTSLLNYTLEHTVLGDRVRLVSTVSPWTMMWIAASNLVVQVVTLGLATPWAAVRRAKYVLAHLTVAVVGSLDDFAGEHAPPQSAFGEVATEFFGVDIGL